MLPIPTHLKNFLIVDEHDFDGHNLKGKTRCTCGCENIRLKIYGKNYGSYLAVTKYKGGFRFRVAGICAECGKIFDLIDLSKHGYDGFICHDGLPVDDSDLKEYYCEKCGNNTFSADIEIEPEDPKQFYEEVAEDSPTEFEAEDYVDAFHWFALSLTCTKCGRKLKNWIDLETA